MKKSIFLGAMLFIPLLATAENTATTDDGVEINGVTWATRNVDAAGTFATSPQSAGKFYQWNRNIAWAATGEVTGWDSSIPGGTEWEAENDPCPAGWQVPNADELRKLIDVNNVSYTESTLSGNVKIRTFTDKNTNQSIIVPTAGQRNQSEGLLQSVGTYSSFWGSTSDNGSSAYCLDYYINSPATITRVGSRRLGRFVRCVKSNDVTATPTVPDAVPQPIGYYNILGKKLDKAPDAGIYIILYDDGQAKKAVK